MKLRKITTFLMLLLICSLTFAINVNAKTGETYYTDDGKYNYTTNVIEQTQIGNGTYLTKDFGYTTRGSDQYNQEVFMLSQKSDASKGIKTVTWSAPNPTTSVAAAFSRVTLDKIAEDYELNHPGWKVLGGISSDQFYFSFGTGLVTNGSDVFYNTPYYGMKADGEDWFTVDALGRVGCNMTGFLNDGSNDPLVYGARTSQGFKLNVYDKNNNFVKKFDITELNPLSKTKKTSGDYTYLYSIYSAYYFESEDAFSDPNNTDPDYKSETQSETKLLKEYPVSSNSDNDLYVVGAADRAFVSNSKYWKYKDNHGVKVRVENDTIKWYYQNGSRWINLINATDLPGYKGNGLEAVVDGVYIKWANKNDDQWYTLVNVQSLVNEQSKNSNVDLSIKSVSLNNNTITTNLSNGSTLSCGYMQSGYGFATDAFFGKGTITSVEKSVNLKAKQFAIETTNPELLSALEEGCYVVAQYELDDEMEQCESAVGWHTLQRYNGVDQNVSNSYNSRPYPRSLFGVTEDGTIYLISSNGGNSRPLWGLYGEEANALCKAYGIKTAFQMDGGGSVTMVVRNDNGGFDFLTTPADGSQRSICGGVFFVVRDVDYNTNLVSRTDASLTVDVDITDYGWLENVEKTYVNLNGRTSDGNKYSVSKELTGDSLTFEGLASNSEYILNVSFKVSGSDELVDSLSKVILKTLKKMPTIPKATIDLSDEGDLKVTATIDDPDSSVITSLKVSFDNGETFTKMSATNALTIKEFDGDALGNVMFEVMYDLNDGHTKTVLVPVKMNYNTYTFLSSFEYQYKKLLDSILNN